MKFFSNFFQEFSRPISYIKKTYKDRAKGYRQLKEDIVRKPDGTSDPVSSDVTKEEFKLRYENLIFHQKLVGVFMLYSLIYTASTVSFAEFITALAIFLFFAVNYFSIAYKSYLCRLYFSSWKSRKQRIKFTIYDFVGIALSNIGLLYPCVDINKKI